MAAPVLGKLALGGDADAADQRLASHVHDHAAHGHAAMIGENVPAVGGPRDLDELLYPPPALPYSPGRVREYDIRAVDRELEIAPGDLLPRVDVQRHRARARAARDRGRHPARQLRQRRHAPAHDPLPRHPSRGHGRRLRGRQSGESFTYEFEARPAGFHPYHCHATPLKKHIHKGLYGSLIIDPKEPRPPAQELVMVMNGYDTDADGGNNFYTVNGRSFYYAKYPITVKRSQLVRLYLANLTEFDLINSFHLHADFFYYQPNGTGDYREYTDTVMQCQGQRGVIELEFANTGLFMFHAHQSEFAELGWMGFFNVAD